MDRQHQRFETRTLPYGPDAIAEAARLIAEGLPVAMPTETVYGLAADASNPEAVARIYAVKGRPSFNPLIVHVLDMEQARELGAEPSAAALHIARRYWPGPLTLVVPLGHSARLAPAVAAGLRTVALRSPDHPAMQDLIRATGKPLAAPSANASGRISPTSAGHVLHSLGGRIPLIVDGGPAVRGLESTIVKIVGDTVTTLRPGPVDGEEVAACAKLKLTSGSTGGIEAPGQLASHYAPSKPLRLGALEAEAGEWLIGFGVIGGNDSLSPSGDLAEAASRLFEALHRAEAETAPRIAVAPIPDEGIGRAINDRLRRAAAPRP